MMPREEWAQTTVHQHSRYACAHCGQEFEMPHDVYDHLETCTATSRQAPAHDPERVLAEHRERARQRSARKDFDDYVRAGAHFGAGDEFWQAAAADLGRERLPQLAERLVTPLPRKWRPDPSDKKRG
jgi:hypothetical protein